MTDRVANEKFKIKNVKLLAVSFADKGTDSYPAAKIKTTEANLKK